MFLRHQERETSAQAWSVWLVSVLYIVDFVVCLLSFISVMALGSAGRDGLVGSIARFFNVDQEGNLPSWFSSTQLFILAVLLGIFAWHNFKKSFIASWLLCFLSGIFLVFSLDEASEIHERLGGLTDLLLPSGDRTQTAFGITGLWPFLIGIPAFTVLLLVFLKLKPYFAKTPTVLLKYFAGLIIFMFGAVGVETITNFVVQDGPTVRAFVIHVEEFLEMAGITTMVWATSDLLRAYHLRILLDPVEISPTQTDVPIS